MQRKVRINAFEVYEDIRSGMTDADLMEKYSLSESMLGRLFQKLADFYRKHPVDDRRKARRVVPSTPVSVRDLSRPGIVGTLVDISRTGIAVAGIDANQGEVTTLKLKVDDNPSLDKVVFEARCVWSQSVSTKGASSAGFQITAVTEQNFRKLAGMIRSVAAES